MNNKLRKFLAILAIIPFASFSILGTIIIISGESKDFLLTAVILAILIAAAGYGLHELTK